jgi:hypothetical protein
MMRRILVVALVLALARSAFAVSGSEVAFVGGSAAGFKPGDIGGFDMSPATELVFVSDGRRLSIPYDGIRRVEYRKENAFHLGVAATIVVGLVKQRIKKHFFTVSYVDGAGVNQAAVFEVAKEAPKSLLAVFAARAPQACLITDEYRPCSMASR